MNAISKIHPDLLTLHGRGGGGKGGGSSGGVEAPNTLRSDAVVNVIDVLSEGQIEGFVNSTYPGASIYFNNTPLQDSAGNYNFEGINYEIRYGSPDQTPVSGYPAVQTTTTISEEVTVRSGPVVRTITNSADTSVLITITVPALYVTDTSNGNINDFSFSLRIDVQPAGGSSYEAVADRISGKCVSPYQRTYKLAIPPGTAFPIQITMTRTSPDDGVATQLSAFEWTAITEQIEHKLIYPDTAYVALTVDASAFAGNIPTRSYEINGIQIQIPANYDPIARTYASTGAGTTAGTWDGVTFKTAWSNNPAWVLYDLLTNARYGLGDTIIESAVDVWSLYTIGQYCDGTVPDGNGGIQTRYVFNGVISSQADAYQTVQLIASSFLGLAYWGAGQITIVQDAPALPTKLFTDANVIDGRFEYQGTALNARHSIAQVQWLDPSNEYRATIDLVSDPVAIRQFGSRTKKITGVGITNRSQAIRMAKWALDTEKYATETVVFNCGPEEADLRPGNVIAILDSNYAGARFGGRTIVPPVALALGRTNLIPNGSAAGAVGSTNTLPTGWALSVPYGLTSQVVATGISDSGIGFVDIQFTGEISSGSLVVDTALSALTAPIAVASSANFTGSAYLKLMYGSVSQLTSATVHVQTYHKAGGMMVIDQDVASANLVSQIANQYARGSATATATSSSTYGNTRVTVTPATGTPLNFVLRIGGIQLEQNSAASNYISTVGVASTVTESNPSVIALDQTVTLATGQTYTLYVTDPQGLVQTGTVSTAAGSTNVITLATPLAAAPPPGSIWILSSAALEPRLFRVLSIAEKQKNMFEVNALFYDPTKYARVEDNIQAPANSYSDNLPAPSTPIPVPSGVAAIEYLQGSGTTTLDTVIVSWSSQPDGRITGYEVQALDPSGNILSDQTTVNLTVSLVSLTIGSYYFRVRSLTASGGYSQWSTSAEFAVTGVASAPNEPTALACVAGYLNNILTWTNPINPDLKWIEIWRATSAVFSTASIIQEATATTYVDANLTPEQEYYYWIRAVNTTGAQSAFEGPVSGTPSLIGSAQLAQNILTINNFASSIQPVVVWTGSSLPTTLAATGGGTVLLWSSDNNLYRWNGTAFVNTVAASNITGTIVASQIAAIPASKISGTLAAAQIASLAASQITGTLTASQIASLATSQLTGTITSTQIGANSVTTAAIAAGAVTASQIAANTITAGQLAANAVTAASIAAGTITSSQIAAGTIQAGNIASGAITASLLQVGSPNNVVWNSCLTYDSQGWVLYGPVTGGPVAGSSLSSQWLLPSGSGYMTASSFSSGTYCTATWVPPGTSSYGVPVVPGHTYIAQAALTGQNCTCRVEIAWRTSTGAYISGVVSPTLTPTSGAGTTLSNYTVEFIVGVAPATAAFGVLTITGNPTVVACTNPLVVWTQALFGEVSPNVQGPVLWTPGGVTQISGGQIVSNTITANQIAANTITAGQIAANTITTSQLATGTLSASNITTGTLNAGVILGSLANFGTVQITNAQIANLTVTTSLIAPNAVSQYTFASFAGPVSGAQNYTLSLTNPTGSVILFSLLVTGYTNAGSSATLVPGSDDSGSIPGYYTVSTLAPIATASMYLGSNIITQDTGISAGSFGPTYGSIPSTLPSFYIAASTNIAPPVSGQTVWNVNQVQSSAQSGTVSYPLQYDSGLNGSTTYTLSTYFYIPVGYTGGAITMSVTGHGGTIVNTSVPTTTKGSWFRVSSTFTTGSGCNPMTACAFNFSFASMNQGTAPGYTANSAQDVYVSCPQVEVGSSATAFAPSVRIMADYTATSVAATQGGTNIGVFNGTNQVFDQTGTVGTLVYRLPITVQATDGSNNANVNFSIVGLLIKK